MIFNTADYRWDTEFEEAAKEGQGMIQAAGGVEALKDRVDVGPFWVQHPK